MIVRESDILMAALDRRLTVERVLPLDPFASVANGFDPVRGARTGSASTPTVPSNDSNTPSTRALLANLPIGQVVSARIVDGSADGSADGSDEGSDEGSTHGGTDRSASGSINGRVVVQIGESLVSMAWPNADGAAPGVGTDIALRVVAHRPMLVFQHMVGGEASDAVDPDASTRWSDDALRLQQSRGPAGRATSTGRGPLLFDIPLLEIDRVPHEEQPDDPDSATERRSPHDAATRPPSLVGVASAAQAEHGRTIVDTPSRTAMASVDDLVTPTMSRSREDAPPLAPFMPLVLQGPAWPGQTMDFIVRHERDDDQFDNPALDHWCSEVVIDLPRLGRIAGHLSCSMHGLRLRLEGDDEASVAAMSAATAELAAAFADADLRVAGLTVGCPAADSNRAAAAITAFDRHG